MAILVEEDLVGCLLLNELRPLLDNHECAVFVSRKPVHLPPDSVQGFEELLVVQWHIPMRVVFPSLDARDDSGAEHLLTFKGIASRYNLPLEYVERIDEGFLVSLAQLSPEVGVVARFSHILPHDALEAAPHGFLNIHPGRLPSYAGKNAPLHAMAAGDSSLGCSVIRLDDGIDTGDIAAVGELPVQPRRSLLWHIIRAYRPGIEACIGLVERLSSGGSVDFVPQNLEGRVYRRYLPVPDMMKLIGRYGLVHWSELAAMMEGFGALKPSDQGKSELSRLFEQSNGTWRLR